MSVVSTIAGVLADEMTSYPVSTGADMSVAARYPGSLLFRHFIPHAIRFNRIILVVWLFVGLFGNVLSAVIWLQRRMRRHNSSAIYVAALSVNCVLFLVVHSFNALKFQFDVHLYSMPVICQVFNVLYFLPQHLSPLLVLAFTVDRYIVVCHPLRRQIYCRQSRALKVTAGLVAGSSLVASFYAYIYTYDGTLGQCRARETTTTINVYVWTTEMTYNLVAPLTTIVLNVLVIRSLLASRSARHEQLMCRTVPQKGDTTSKTATTLMLLTVSFFYVATTLPMTVVYVVHPGFQPGDDHMTDQQVLADVTWTRYLNYRQVEFVVYGLSLSHFACNFFIFIPTGRQFRRALFNLLLCRREGTSNEKRATGLTTLTTASRTPSPQLKP